jgi:hydroxymethylglutaryl-CoA lyase
VGESLADAGLSEIEVGSFVSPKALPQMADAAMVVAQALTIPHLRVGVLVPNLKYARMALEAGAHLITIPVSVSEPHSIRNIRMTHPQIVAEVKASIALRNDGYPKTTIEVGLSTAFGCTIQGIVPEADTVRMTVVMAECGVDSINLSDSVGYANPAQVRRLFTQVRNAIGEKTAGVLVCASLIPFVIIASQTRSAWLAVLLIGMRWPATRHGRRTTSRWLPTCSRAGQSDR